MTLETPKHYTYKPLEVVEEEHRQLRLAAYQLVQNELEEAGLFITIRSIDEDAALVADAWQYTADLKHRTPGWQWINLHGQYRQRPSRVEAAIWCPDEEGNEILGALVYGNISKRRMFANIAFIEGNPESVTQIYGQVVAVASRYLEAHATMLECQNVGIMNPIPKLIDHYKDNGFEYEEVEKGRVTRLYRPLTGKGKSDIVGAEEP